MKGLRSLTIFSSGSTFRCCATCSFGALCLGLPQRPHIAKPTATMPPPTMNRSCFMAASVRSGEAGRMPVRCDGKMAAHLEERCQSGDARREAGDLQLRRPYFMNTAPAVRTTGTKPITMMKMRYARSSAMARTPYSAALGVPYACWLPMTRAVCANASCTCQPRKGNTNLRGPYSCGSG